MTFALEETRHGVQTHGMFLSYLRSIGARQIATTVVHLYANPIPRQIDWARNTWFFPTVTRGSNPNKEGDLWRKVQLVLKNGISTYHWDLIVFFLRAFVKQITIFKSFYNQSKRKAWVKIFKWLKYRSRGWFVIYFNNSYKLLSVTNTNYKYAMLTLRKLIKQQN